jgi:Zn-finger nucleic acid-binding protein
MGDRLGVEVNYCPTCRGVWLGRGVLDKIIDRSVETSGRSPNERYRDHDGRDRHDEHGHEGQRRKSFLSNLFD